MGTCNFFPQGLTYPPYPYTWSISKAEPRGEEALGETKKQNFVVGICVKGRVRRTLPLTQMPTTNSNIMLTLILNLNRVPTAPSPQCTTRLLFINGRGGGTGRTNPGRILAPPGLGGRRNRGPHFFWKEF